MMQRGKGHEVAKRCEQGRVDEGRRGPCRPAVDDAMSDGVGTDAAALETVEEPEDGHGVVRDRLTDTFHGATRDLALLAAADIEQRVLERGRPAIEREDAHAVRIYSPGHAR
jgi:hypothetical protein